MKHALVLIWLFLATALFAWEVNPYGPQDMDLSCASFEGDVPVLGAQFNNYHGICLDITGQWYFHQHWMQFFPVKAVQQLTPGVYMCAFGDGSFSDGIYNYDVDEDSWILNEWFMWPNFIVKHNPTGSFFVGERDGLFRSDDAVNWYRVNGLPVQQCDSFAWWGSNMVADIGYAVYYSSDAGQTWLQSTMPLLEGFRFASNGTLFAKMDAGSDSDGLWRSDDRGATWNLEFYTTGLAKIGPIMGGTLPLGWRIPNEAGHYMALYDLQGNLEQMVHTSLDSPVRQLDIFPLVNTPAFLVLNANGCFFITSFPVEDSDPVQTPPLADFSLSVSPNPAGSQISVTAFKAFNKPDVTLYDLRGRKLMKLAASLNLDGSLSCALPDLPTAVYLLRVRDGVNRYAARICVRD